MEEGNKTTENPQNDKPWLWKKGVFTFKGPGRPKGSVSLKDWARKHIKELSDEDKDAFLDALPKQLVWQMAEGNPDNKQEIKHDIGTSFTPEEIEAAKQIIVKRLNTNNISGTTGESK